MQNFFKLSAAVRELSTVH